jgi:hypothetical protein
MSNDQEKVQELLGELETILMMIVPLREEVAELQSQLEMVQGDYDSRLGALNRERAELELEREYLQAKLLNEAPPPPMTPPAKAPPSIVAPAFDDEIIESPRRDPRTRRKQELADHLLYFVDDANEAVKLAINQALVDPDKDIGDMLERLEWGDIWQTKASWEAPEEQIKRLESWRDALQGRLVYWEGKRRELDTHGLLEEWRERDKEEWDAYLDRQAAQQETELIELRQAVDLLRQRLQDRLSKAEGR